MTENTVSEVALPNRQTPGDFANGPTELMVLNWEEVKGAAQLAFDVWESGGELRWAKEVWERTIAAGKATYSNEIERHRAAVLFLGLPDGELAAQLVRFVDDHRPEFMDAEERKHISPILLSRTLAVALLPIFTLPNFTEVFESTDVHLQKNRHRAVIAQVYGCQVEHAIAIEVPHGQLSVPAPGCRKEARAPEGSIPLSQERGHLAGDVCYGNVQLAIRIQVGGHYSSSDSW